MSLFFFSSRRRHTRFDCDWSSDVCSSDLERLARIVEAQQVAVLREELGDGDLPLTSSHLDGGGGRGRLGGPRGGGPGFSGLPGGGRRLGPLGFWLFPWLGVRFVFGVCFWVGVGFVFSFGLW